MAAATECCEWLLLIKVNLKPWRCKPLAKEQKKAAWPSLSQIPTDSHSLRQLDWTNPWLYSHMFQESWAEMDHWRAHDQRCVLLLYTGMWSMDGGIPVSGQLQVQWKSISGQFPSPLDQPHSTGWYHWYQLVAGVTKWRKELLCFGQHHSLTEVVMMELQDEIVVNFLTTSLILITAPTWLQSPKSNRMSCIS